MARVWTRDGDPVELLASVNGCHMVASYENDEQHPLSEPWLTVEKLFDSEEEVAAYWRENMKPFIREYDVAYAKAEAARRELALAQQDLATFQQVSEERVAWLKEQDAALQNLQKLLEHRNAITHLVVVEDDSGNPVWEIVPRAAEGVIPYRFRTQTLLALSLTEDGSLQWRGLAHSLGFCKRVLPATSLEDAVKELKRQVDIAMQDPASTHPRMLKACKRYLPEVAGDIEATVLEAQRVRDSEAIAREVQQHVAALEKLLGHPIKLEHK